MNKQEILAKMQDIFRDVLNNDDIVLTEETTAQDIEEWNSLTQVQLITTIEHEFNIRFSLMEMMNWTKVGEIAAGIQGKL
ncbi:MAG: acyl carrier protein [Prevotellaceae bacterium]|nr:acyl carrier protein [Candidatus Faecinaster equi]